ncbi:FMN-binding negative transcriptional regulator [Falsiroseomonas bella]|uniref:FMN-binding negative transcriptional regulator n=1 Tax=Falsiroseomonas bella TaxID=2184016 RepID=A0A317F8K5_9PROT|nr:FMN-binding negative transcriptional regulator [Falsiroseomonas bella]PWS34347.1 FMN-binding negative transcriptional regulator [Falsiroseomonas bella]
MYVHPAFRTETADALAMLGARGFGLLVIADAAGLPHAVHIPFLAKLQADGLRIELHVARANPIHGLLTEAGRPALLAVQGPDAYLSPDWYDVPNQVPTWTYTAVHLSGTARTLPAEALPGHLERLSDAFEGRLAPKAPWRMEKVEPHRLEAMMRAIVGIEILVPAEGIEAQRKLIQHKGETEHRGAIAGLSARPDPAAHAVAALMGESLATKQAAKGA